MFRTLTLVAVLGLALNVAGAADAAACRDAAGKFIKCATPAAASSYTLDAKGNCHDAKGKMAKKTLCAASAPANATASTAASAMASSSGPNCKKGKRCGNACISVKDVCHK
jgi:hypothetical protein